MTGTISNHNQRSQPVLSSSPKTNGGFSLYAEYSSSRRGSIPSLNEFSNNVLRKTLDTINTSPTVGFSKNFVPSKLTTTSSGSSSETHSRQSSFQTDRDTEDLPSIYAKQSNRTSLTPSSTSLEPYSLLKMAPNIVKTRKGSVLARNTILKMDHFSRGTNTNLDFHLQGAPNFRIAELNVHGVAQPTVIGLSTILALLNCHPKSLKPTSCTWFSTREEPLVYINGMPYVLREYADPMQNMSAFLGISSGRLEKVEERLKSDVMKEAKSLGGLLLVHQELSDGTVVPCFIAADTVKTPKETFQSIQEEGYRIKYFRIPISPEQAPENNYFDEYINVIRNLDPNDPLIFNCGIGAVRTTVGIIIAQIIRRTQLIEKGEPDPFPVAGWSYPSIYDSVLSPSSSNDFQMGRFAKGADEADNFDTKNNALLRLFLILEDALNTRFSSKSAVEWILERGPLIENLKDAIMGNYQSIISLTTVLESGTYSKKLLDTIIDRSDAVVNLRESILSNRILQTAHVSSSDFNENHYLNKALSGLQRYFFLLCFTAYVNESPNTNFEVRFSDWVRSRTEIWAMLQNMRRKGPRLYFFRPVEDLHLLGSGDNGKQIKSSSIISKSKGQYTQAQGMFDMTGAGQHLYTGVTIETEKFVLNSRTGIVLTSQTILKVDFWQYDYLSERNKEHNEHKNHEFQQQQQQQHLGVERHHGFVIDGASNFRHIPDTHVYGVAQPTVNGLRQVIRTLFTEENNNCEKILWINLREEPIIYINGIPYVLRDRAFTIRNLRAYKGITGSRMEQVEERLKEDVIREVTQYGGKILLHGEDKDGNVLSCWEEVDIQDIMTVREVMETTALEVQKELLVDSSSDSSDDYELFRRRDAILDYQRVPITAEKAPERKDFDDLTSLITQVDLSRTSIILNCQVGLGRSTSGTIIASLLTRWIRPKSVYHKNISRSHLANNKYLNYQIINSLLRLIKRGLENKCIVDTVIDQCSVNGKNLRDTIEEARIQAEKEKEEDPEQYRRTVKKGVTALERYFMFICFQAYLDSTSPSLVRDTESFSFWIKQRPELDTILELLRATEKEDGFVSLIPVEQSLGSGDGLALSSEVIKVVKSRHGQVLAQQTILKHDAFPGCQKMSLKEKISGAYNFRRVEVSLVRAAVKHKALLAATKGGLAADMERDDQQKLVAPFIAGCAMPHKDAIKAILKAMQAGPGGKRWVYWTCLREEPVLYVNKNPYVLRLFIDPLKNLETTGISKERVESMEERMRLDVLQELGEYDGRMLLHDEDSNFNLLPLWETVPSDQIETPSQVFESIKAEGYQVNFLRIPITDEQAPIPDVFDQLIKRMQEANQGVNDVIFNCQMGRGRTTTGMVVASLFTMILNNDALDNLANSFASDSTEQEDDSDESIDERERYMNGEYRVILQLVSVLTYGKLAKHLTDRAINMCDHMQNLRKAIYDYKLRVETMTDQGSIKWKATREVALNYLVRYFYLIVFANYLLEEMGTTVTTLCTVSSSAVLQQPAQDTVDDNFEFDKRGFISFKEWLKGRREIVNIISLHSLELS
ncbi:inositol hexakisphosphate-domain-containing protein [Mycotypha africana]|uniref:inositol hexakisphosphate-domain-containing protein n=1 Tax=Mycotypha africana TaxID=64632 RepID=UPI00230000FA|nr:inositol hexakisphosphate-domain-containing protein [Mycotypha africana]KAI8984466.1 inositol hexakisphosphate-domain-containing protein [Mycotypha africana]